ncbi:MAG: hypothetical protein NC429_08470 [Lachnospiraceae bacterium]|nr:hypothetical protein [Lachnospiraceae bacterium]
MDDIIVEFYSGKYEEKINKKSLYYSYDFPRQEVVGYVEKIISEPIDRYIAYIKGLKKIEQITAKDVFQFSDMKHATVVICEKVKAHNNLGMKYIDIGKILLDDGKVRKDGAYTKYGENHVKTAEAMGLFFELSRTYFLSCLGYIYCDLPNEDRDKLLTRLLLRNRLIIRLVQASENGNINAREFFYMLSDSTYLRRRSNVKAVLNILKSSEEYNFKDFVNKIIL